MYFVNNNMHDRNVKFLQVNVMRFFFYKNAQISVNSHDVQEIYENIYSDINKNK